MPAKRYNCTDLGNAKYFADFVKGNLIYNYRAMMWYEWNGVLWLPCVAGREWQWAKDAVKDMLRHASTINNGAKRKQYANHALKSESRPRLEAMMQLAKSEKTIANAGDDWDKDPFLLGTPSGVLDLRTGKMRKPNRQIKLTYAIAIAFDPKAKCPAWEKFLNEIYDNDVEVVAYVKRILGYSLTGSVKEQSLYCLWGNGANGKSTLLDTVQYIMGQYAYAMPFSTIEHNKNGSISNDLAQLYGRRFVQASETQEGVRLNEGRLKSLTGGDVVTARFLYKDLFSYMPTAKFILAFNHKPIITDDSEGAWRRIHLIEHRRVFKKHERDPDLTTKLRKEAAGILNWMIEGCLEWQRDGLQPPQSVSQATQDYRDEMNPLREFLEEHCTVHPDALVRVSDLWTAYNDFADGNRDRFKLNPRKYNERLESMGFRRGTKQFSSTDVAKCWFGITLESNPTKNNGSGIEVVH
jgi:putative DNA primase/helicase